MAILKSGPTLVYQQVADWITQQINSGIWPEHYKLPSEFDLAEQLEVSRGTVRKAFSELIKNGILVAIHGRGTYVSSQKLEQPLAEELIAFSEDLINKGIPFETKVIEQGLRSAPQQVASLLSVRGDPVFYLKRVRSINGTPIILIENYVSCQQCPGIEQVDFNVQRLFDTFENTYGLALGWGWRTFEARIATDQVAELLHTAACAPVMYMEQLVNLMSGEPIEYSNIWLKGDSFRLSALVKRDKSIAVPQNSLKIFGSSI